MLDNPLAFRINAILHSPHGNRCGQETNQQESNDSFVHTTTRAQNTRYLVVHLIFVLPASSIVDVSLPSIPELRNLQLLSSCHPPLQEGA
jgi:hypothetical protein